MSFLELVIHGGGVVTNTAHSPPLRNVSPYAPVCVWVLAGVGGCGQSSVLTSTLALIWGTGDVA